MSNAKTLIIGLGNPILGDDGVGWRVADEVQKRINQPDIEIDFLSLGGLSLMERLTGYERVILIDAVVTGQNPVGTVRQFALNDLPDFSAGHSTSAHDTSLRTALNVGRGMDISLPKDEDVTVVAIEAHNVYDFTEQLSAPVTLAVPKAVDTVLEILEKIKETKT